MRRKRGKSLKLQKSSTKNGVFFGSRPVPMPKTGPTEASEQRRLVGALRRAGVVFVHVPMGGARSRASGSEMRSQGAQKGFPDLLIFDAPLRSVRRPGSYEWPVGIALELKRPVRGSEPKPEQIFWLEQLAERGWLATVQWGADAALEYLRDKGYDV